VNFLYEILLRVGGGSIIKP